MALKKLKMDNANDGFPVTVLQENTDADGVTVCEHCRSTGRVMGDKLDE